MEVLCGFNSIFKSCISCEAFYHSGLRVTLREIEFIKVSKIINLFDTLYSITFVKRFSMNSHYLCCRHPYC